MNHDPDKNIINKDRNLLLKKYNRLKYLLFGILIVSMIILFFVLF